MRRLQIDKKLNDPVKMLSKTFYKGKGVPSDKKSFKYGDNFHKGHLKNCEAEGRTSYNCGKKRHLSTVCKSKTDKKQLK